MIFARGNENTAPSVAAANGGAAKRLFDVAVGGLLGLLALPVVAIAAVVVWATMGRPVFFRQRRAGLHGVPFELVKLRTMRVPMPGEDAVEFDGRRLTRLGRFLRETSIDELPTLWNVLRGEMSLVGPRPLFVEYLPRYTEVQARRLLAKPGLTGWAQLHGRNGLSWEEKFALDVWYVDHQTMRLDLRILLRTVVVVLRREGIAAAGAATMPEFRGLADRLPVDG